MTQIPTLPLHMRRNGFSPVDALAEARDNEGVVRVETPIGPGFLVCRNEDFRQVLSDSRRFSAASPLPGDEFLTVEEQEKLRAGQLLSFDPPEHTRLRRMLTAEFTVRRMRRLEPRIVAIVDDALDALERAGRPADLVEHFALPVPSLVICELLGVPRKDRARFHDTSVRMLDTALPMERRVVAQQEGRDYMAGLVDRAFAAPGEDMLGMLVRDHGDDLNADELAGIGQLLLLAGHETTANMLGLGTLALLRHPEQSAALREDPSLVEAGVEELLRWLSIVQSLPTRTTTTDVELAGQAIPAGSLVICSIPAANRDPAFIDDPEALDLARGAAGHLAFGHGVHHCLGAPLARMELRIAFPALLRRFPDLALADSFEDVEYRSSSLVYGVRSLPVTW